MAPNVVSVSDTGPVCGTGAPLDASGLPSADLLLSADSAELAELLDDSPSSSGATSASMVLAMSSASLTCDSNSAC